MTKVFACISHKGGTGRTVTTVNVAYQLARQGNTVCVIDLDLASPTLGSAVGLERIAGGADVGVHDVLIGSFRPENVEELEWNVWKSPHISDTFRLGTSGDFRIIPGVRDGGDQSMEGEHAASRLGKMLAILKTRYDYIFCDLRSGVSLVCEAFLDYPISGYLDAWLLFFRWTNQHLVGVKDLGVALREVLDSGEHSTVPLFLIRTAAIDPSTVDGRLGTWIARRHGELQQELRTVKIAMGHSVRELGTVSLNPVLQWSERILTERDLDATGDSQTIADFRVIADEIASL